MRSLFVCSAGMLRSPTAAQLWNEHGLQAKYAGAFSFGDKSRALTEDKIAWADAIYCMELQHVEVVLKELIELNDSRAGRSEHAHRPLLYCLQIRDIYERHAPELRLLLTPWLQFALQLNGGKSD